jgi:endonuclease IV
MLIGAHVSPAGGPANAVARGVERGCRAIQIFNQSPRQWKPNVYDDEKVAAYEEAIKARIMRGASRPVALMIGEGSRGSLL